MTIKNFFEVNKKVSDKCQNALFTFYLFNLFFPQFKNANSATTSAKLALDLVLGIALRAKTTTIMGPA